MHRKKTIGILAFLCLAVKIICFFVWQKVWDSGEYPLIWLSIAYYLLLGALCFCSGWMRRSTVALAGALGAEVLVVLIVLLFNGPLLFGALYLYTTPSHYALIRLLEKAGLSGGWEYCAALMIVQLLFLGIHCLEKKRSAR